MCWQASWYKEGMTYAFSVLVPKDYSDEPEVHLQSYHNNEGTHLSCINCKLNEGKELRLSAGIDPEDIQKAQQHIQDHVKAGHNIINEYSIEDWLGQKYFYANMSKLANEFRERINELEKKYQDFKLTPKGLQDK